MKNQNITFSSAYETLISFEFSKAYSLSSTRNWTNNLHHPLFLWNQVPQTKIIHRERERSITRPLMVPPYINVDCIVRNYKTFNIPVQLFMLLVFPTEEEEEEEL